MVKVSETSGDTLLREATAHVQRLLEGQLVCPACAGVASGCDSRTHRSRRLYTLPWKPFIEAATPQVNCPSCGLKQIRVAWPQDASCFTQLFEVYVIRRGKPPALPEDSGRFDLCGGRGSL